MAGECRLDRTGGIAGDSLSSQYGRYLKSRRGARDGHAVALETDGYTILSPDEVDAGDLADRMNPAIV